MALNWYWKVSEQKIKNLCCPGVYKLKRRYIKQNNKQNPLKNVKYRVSRGL